MQLNYNKLTNLLRRYEQLSGVDIPKQHHSIIFAEVFRMMERKPIRLFYPVAAATPSGYMAMLRRANVDIEDLTFLVIFLVNNINLDK